MHKKHLIVRTIRCWPQEYSGCTPAIFIILLFLHTFTIQDPGVGKGEGGMEGEGGGEREEGGRGGEKRKQR